MSRLESKRKYLSQKSFTGTAKASWLVIIGLMSAEIKPRKPSQPND